jgi:glycosyltransferase involved in cell wall biosynthesis
VIAFNRGSSPEIIRNEISGYVVDTFSEMVKAVQHVEAIDRLMCRRYALEHFNAQRMADGYERMYRKVLSQKIEQVKIPELASIEHGKRRNFVFSPDFS